MTLLFDADREATTQEFVNNTFDPALKRVLGFMEPGEIVALTFNFPGESSRGNVPSPVGEKYMQRLQEAVAAVTPTSKRYRGVAVSDPVTLSKTVWSGDPEYPNLDIVTGCQVLVSRNL